MIALLKQNGRNNQFVFDNVDNQTISHNNQTISHNNKYFGNNHGIVWNRNLNNTGINIKWEVHLWHNMKHPSNSDIRPRKENQV